MGAAFQQRFDYQAARHVWTTACVDVTLTNNLRLFDNSFFTCSVDLFYLDFRFRGNDDRVRSLVILVPHQVRDRLWRGFRELESIRTSIIEDAPLEHTTVAM